MLRRRGIEGYPIQISWYQHQMKIMIRISIINTVMISISTVTMINSFAQSVQVNMKMVNVVTTERIKSIHIMKMFAIDLLRMLASITNVKTRSKTRTEGKLITLKVARLSLIILIGTTILIKDHMEVSIRNISTRNTKDRNPVWFTRIKALDTISYSQILKRLKRSLLETLRVNRCKLISPMFRKRSPKQSHQVTCKQRSHRLLSRSRSLCTIYTKT